jgi:hypothetical protein
MKSSFGYGKGPGPLSGFKIMVKSWFGSAVILPPQSASCCGGNCIRLRTGTYASYNGPQALGTGYMYNGTRTVDLEPRDFFCLGRTMASGMVMMRMSAMRITKVTEMHLNRFDFLRRIWTSMVMRSEDYGVPSRQFEKSVGLDKARRYLGKNIVLAY